MKLIFVSTGLGVGGAEMMLFKLLSSWSCPDDELEVISLTGRGSMARRLEAAGVPVRSLNLRGVGGLALGWIRLARWLRSSRASVVQTWMYHADLFGGLAAKLSGIPVIWGIRNGVLDRGTDKRRTIQTAQACARLSRRLPRRITCVSEQARVFHERMGYCGRKFVIIPNGFDLAAFKPDPIAALDLRAELALPSAAILIGLVARFDPKKDHLNFIEAAARVAARRSGVFFVLCGDGVMSENNELTTWIAQTGAAHRFRLLGRRDDVARVLAGLDILALASCHEAFPNVLGEAMASGVACVTTDAGDSAYIVGDTGKVVPTRQPERLADALEELIDLGPEGRRRLGDQARRRVQAQFDLSVVRERYAALYRETVEGSAPPSLRRCWTT